MTETIVTTPAPEMQESDKVSAALKPIDDIWLLDSVTPMLAAKFRLLRAHDGTERIFQANEKGEAVLNIERAHLEQVAYDVIRYKSNRPAKRENITRAIDLWRLECPKLEGEPEPFCFAGDDRLCFKRFDWQPTEGEFPAWEEFLSRLSDRPAFMAFVWSCFETKNKSRQYVWLRGEGEDGKSTVLNLLAEVFGTAGTALSGAQVDGNKRFIGSLLYGKRLVVYPDCKNSKLGMSELVRNITSGDTVPIEFKGQTPFQAVLFGKLMVGSNQKPEISTQAADLSRQIYIEVAESKQKDDPAWVENLKAQLPHFLHACRKQYEEVCPKHGKIPVNKKTKELQEDSTSQFEAQFLDLWEEHFEEAPEGSGSVKAADLAKWLRMKGVTESRRQADFHAWLERTHNVRYHRTKETREYRGLKFKPDTGF